MTSSASAANLFEGQFAFADALADMDRNMELFGELVAIYEEELPLQLELLKSTAFDVPRLLHALNEAANTLAIVGARLDAHRVRELEASLRGGDMSSLPVAASMAAAAMERTDAALRRWMDTRRS